ncbi:MAG TPA: fructose-bisphosphate aldolase [Gammaproteobacteria bacterium]|nr:fructose-bisphosphate aldolase [Gammaproteobacteria bacterium]
MAGLRLGEKAVVVAMDHVKTLGLVPGLDDPGAVVDQMLEAGVDGVMTSYGIIKQYADRLIGRVPTFLRLDGGPTIYREDWLQYSRWSLMHSVADAHALGVDGVCVMAFMGADVELDTYEIVTRVAGDCHRFGLPLMVEALPCPTERIPDTKDPEAMAAASRIAFELGADIVKTYYTGTPEGFSRVTGCCPVPVLLAGGPKMDTLRDTLQVVHDSVQVGGCGVVFGRNIWQAKDPAAVVRGLRAVIHDGASVEAALAATE